MGGYEQIPMAANLGGKKPKLTVSRDWALRIFEPPGPNTIASTYT